MPDLAQPFLLAQPNSRLFVVPLSDTTLMIQVWASSADELQGWLPQARSFIDSMELLNDYVAPAAAVSSSNFELPFRYELPAGVSPLITRDWTDMFALITRSSTSDLGTTWPANQDLYPPESNGLVIASTTHAAIYGCPHVGLGASVHISPTNDVASQLRELGGFAFQTTPTSVDGYAASVTTAISLQSDPPPTSCSDGLVVNLADGSTAATILLARYRDRIYFVPIRDTTLVIQVWSGGPAEDQWFETADQIVQSIDFAGN